MAISVATARPACPTTISCVKPGKSSLTIKRGLEERLVEEEPDAKRMRFTSQPLADELIITPLDHTIAATAVFQSFGIEVTGNDYCPIIPGLPAPWEKFTEEPLAPVDGGSSSFAPSSSGPEQTSYVPPPIIASSGPTFGYDEFLAGLDPALLDESLPGPSTPSPHAAVAAQKECPNPHAERAMTPPPEEPAAGDMNCAQPTERNPDERPPVEGRAERKKKQVSSPKNSLRATAHKRAHAFRTKTPVLSSPFYEHEYVEYRAGTPNVASKRLLPPLGSYIYDIPEDKWPELDISRPQQCTRQVFLGGSIWRTAELLRSHIVRSLHDRIVPHSSVRLTIEPLQSKGGANSLVAVRSHPAAIRYWFEHARAVHALKTQPWKTTKDIVPSSIPSYSPERPQPLVDPDVPTILQNLDAEEEDSEDVDVFVLPTEEELGPDAQDLEAMRWYLEKKLLEKEKATQDEDEQSDSDDSDYSDDGDEANTSMSYDDWTEMASW